MCVVAYFRRTELEFRRGVVYRLIGVRIGHVKDIIDVKDFNL